MTDNKKILLHICCGVCASWPVRKLREDGYEVVGFFYNPNIYPHEEYQKRLNALKEVAKLQEFQLVEGVYDSEDWVESTSSIEYLGEGSKRCSKCYEIRLKETQSMAKKLGINYFTTTLTVSPHKKAIVINDIGSTIDMDMFVQYDFKKKNGFKIARDFARQHKIYCQTYCGCKESI